MLFVAPAAIAVPIVAGFLLGGPMLGFLLAAVLALVIVAGALRVGTRGRRAGPRWWQRGAGLRFLIPMAVAVAGILVVVLGSGTLRVIGWGVVAVAITLAISLVFLEIGYGEERARARGDEDPTVRSDASRQRLRSSPARRPESGRAADAPDRR